MSGTCGAVVFLCSPSGPGTPFGAPWMVVWDCARLVAVVAALVVAVVTPRMALVSRTRWQGARFLAVALFAVVAAMTEAEHLGDNPSIRLLLNLAAAVYMLVGYWGMWRHEMAFYRDGDPP